MMEITREQYEAAILEAQAQILRDAADEITQRIKSVAPRSLRGEDLDAGGLNVCSALRHMSSRLDPR